MGLLFASPWIVGFLVFTVYPVILSFYYSLNVYTTFGQPMQWVGLQNYVDLLTQDDLFWVSLYNTLYMVVIGIPFHITLAVLLALLLNMSLRGVSIYRTVFYLPTIVPIVATSVLWMWVLNPEYGLINAALAELGIHGPGWLTDPELAKPSLILMGVWTIGGTLVIFLAGLQDIPRQLYDAAMIDGAGTLSQVRHITLPMLSAVIFFNVVVGVIGGFQIFTQAFIMTERGAAGRDALLRPLPLSECLQVLQNALRLRDAWILFLIVIAATLIVFRTSARFVYYEGEER